MRRRAAALALLCLLAGCGSAGTATVDRADGETLTAAPLPETTVTDVGRTATPTPTVGEPEGAQLAPGLVTGGLYDPRALASAHADALRNRSFRVVRTTVVVVRNGSEAVNVTRRLRVAAGGQPYHYNKTARRPDGRTRTEVWLDEPSILFRVGVENVSYRRGPATVDAGRLEDHTRRDRLAALYATGTGWEITPRANGTVLQTTVPLPDRVLRVPPSVSDPRNTRLRLRVTRRGRVVDYRLRYDALRDGNRVIVVHRARFTTGVNVTAPTWVDDARVATAD
jgi:hypothetical protein